MKHVFLVLESIALVSLLAGCAAHDNGPPPTDPDDEAHVDAKVINSVGDAQMANAIVAEHTLYPYDFVANGAELNELGQRDLDVLTRFYRSHPGEINIRGGGVSAALIQARTHFVEDALVRGGVDTGRVKMADLPPGGPGMPAEDVVRILAQDRKDAGTGYPDSSNTGSAASGTPAAAQGGAQ